MALFSYLGVAYVFLSDLVLFKVSISPLEMTGASLIMLVTLTVAVVRFWKSPQKN